MFYTYLLKRSYENSFYVGKGCKIRYRGSLIQHLCDQTLFIYPTSSEEEAFRLEDKIWLEMTRRGYKMINLRRPGRYGHQDERSGGVLSEETKLKISLTQKGKEKSEKHRRAILEANRKRLLGTKHTEEHKRKISLALLKEKNPFYGEKHSEETKQKISVANKGNSHSEETKEKIRKSKLGNLNPNYKGCS